MAKNKDKATHQVVATQLGIGGVGTFKRGDNVRLSRERAERLPVGAVIPLEGKPNVTEPEVPFHRKGDDDGQSGDNSSADENTSGGDDGGSGQPT